MLRRHCLALPATALLAAAEQPARFGKLKIDQLRRWMQYADVPGFALVRVAQSKPSYFCAGVQDAASKKPVTPETVFSAASLSKQITAYAVVDLNRRGKWDLDRPLGDFAAINGSPEAGRVTARMALSHSTGFPNWRFNADQKLTPDAEPGKKFRYSGEGYCYLQRVMERITEKPFGRYIREAVFEPLAMSVSTFSWRMPLEKLALPHDRQGSPQDVSKQVHELDAFAEKAGKQPEDWTCEDCESFLKSHGRPALPNNFPINAAASLRTSPVDYAKFLAAAMKQPAFGEKQVSFAGGTEGILGWGLGWGIESINGRTLWWQWGDNGGYKNFVLAEPAKQSGLAVFTNGDKGRIVYDRAITAIELIDHPALVWV